MTRSQKLTSKHKKHIRRHAAIKEIVLTVLILISFGLLVYEAIADPARRLLIAIDVYEIILACILVGEFFIEMHHSRDYRRYLRKNWLFLLASVPIPVTLFEVLRGIRLLRLLRFAKAFEHLDYQYNSWLLIFGRRRP